MNDKAKRTLFFVTHISSLLLTLYFVFTSTAWLKYICIEHSRNSPYTSKLIHVFFSFVLLSISSIALILAILKKRVSVLLLLLTIFLSTCCFIYETQYSKSSYISRLITAKGEKPYEGLGYRYVFVNWIWYTKDIIKSEECPEGKVFHHFNLRPNRSSSTVVFEDEPKRTGK